MGIVQSKIPSCSECDFMENYVDTICDTVITEFANPQDENCSEIKQLTKQFIQSVKSRKISYEKFKEEFGDKIDNEDFLLGKEMENFVDRYKKATKDMNKNKNLVTALIQKMDKETKNKTFAKISDLLFKSDDVLKNIKEEEVKNMSWFQQMKKQGSSLIQWIVDYVKYIARKIKEVVNWCGNNKKMCVLSGLVVFLIVYASACQLIYENETKVNPMQPYVNERDKEYNANNLFSLKRDKRYFEIETKKECDMNLGGKGFCLKTNTTRKWGVYDNLKFWRVGCPVVQWIINYLRQNELFNSFLNILKTSVSLSGDAMQLILGSNNSPVSQKYFEDLQYYNHLYHTTNLLSSVYTSYSIVSSPVALINPYMQMGSVAYNGWWQFTVGMDIRDRKTAIMERNILRPILLHTLEKGLGRVMEENKVKEAMNLLNAINIIITTANDVKYMFMGLSDPAPVIQNFVYNAIKLKKTEQMEVKTLDDKVQKQLNLALKYSKEQTAKLNEILENQAKGEAKIKKGQDELKKGQVELKKGKAELKKGQAELKKGQVELKKGQDELKKGQAELKKETNELDEGQDELKKGQSTILNLLKQIPKDPTTMARNEMCQYLKSKELLGLLDQYNIQNGKIMIELTDNEFVEASDKEILLYVSKSQELKNQAYQAYRLIMKSKDPEIKKQREKLIFEKVDYPTKKNWTLKEATKRLLKDLNTAKHQSVFDVPLPRVASLFSVKLKF